MVSMTDVFSTDNFGRPKVIIDEYDRIVIDHSSPSKPCPSCLCISYMEKGEDWWICPNQGCGALRFQKGWSEMREEVGFLDQVEVDGWEYTYDP